MNYDRMRTIIEQIQYKPNCWVELGQDAGMLFIQTHMKTACSRTKGREVVLSSHRRYLWAAITETELVSAVFDAFKALENHELEEWFKYQNRRIYNPHTHVLALWQNCETEG